MKIKENSIEYLSDNIEQITDGKFRSIFRIRSESNGNLHYNITWKKHKDNINEAFRCECMSWQINSSKIGLCKHILALCKKLSEENIIPKDWFQQAYENLQKLPPSRI